MGGDFGREDLEPLQEVMLKLWCDLPCFPPMCLHLIPRVRIAMYWLILLVSLPFCNRLLSGYTGCPLLKKKKKYTIILLFTIHFQSCAMLCCCLSVKLKLGDDNEDDDDNNCTISLAELLYNCCQ